MRAEPEVSSYEKLLVTQELPTGTSIEYTILDETCTTPVI